MRWGDYLNEQEMRRTISVLKPNNELFEVRVLGSSKKKILSGYFKDFETMFSAFDSIDVRNANVYITLNRLNESVYAREQRNRFVLNPNTTSDTEVTRYEWFFVDLDPVRPAGVSSSDYELEASKELAYKVADYLKSVDFGVPAIAESGNGYHLLYKVNFKATKDNSLIVKKCLEKIGELFNTELVKIDAVNFNPSRICKLHGTKAQKGANTDERPHRFSRLISFEGITETSLDALIKFSGEDLSKRQETKMLPASSVVDASFDLDSFLFNAGITYETAPGDDCVMYRLEECPFDSNHRNGDAKIFHYSNGAIAFKCHHNSCKDYHWQDVRLKYDSDAYSKQDDFQRVEEAYQRRKKSKKEKVEIADEIPFEPKQGKNEKKKKQYRKLKKASDLNEKDLPEPAVLIGVGSEVPLLVEGTCILSAKPKLGKSWLALAMCIALSRGDDFLGYKTKKCSTLYLDLETSEQLQQKRLRKALNGEQVPDNFYLDTEADSIDDGLVKQIEDYLVQDPAIGLIVIDVFQIIRSKASSIKETEYEHAYRDIAPLNEIAQKHHISIMLVCHDRKATDPDDPFSNILGSTGLQGAASQMIVMFNRKKGDPIHISVKGKAIDGLPELNVKLDSGQWSIVDGASGAEAEQIERENAYMSSNIRAAVVKIASIGEWRGSATDIINEAARQGIGIAEDSKRVGGFIFKNIGLFMLRDNIQIDAIRNGTGGRTYNIRNSSLVIVDDFVPITHEAAQTLPFS